MSIEKMTEEEQRAYFDRAHEELNDVLADRMVRHIIETAVLPQVGYMLGASPRGEAGLGEHPPAESSGSSHALHGNGRLPCLRLLLGGGHPPAVDDQGGGGGRGGER